MKIKFLGAAGTVTGSSYVLTSGSGQTILVDLGMFQGVPAIDDLNYAPYEYDCSQLFAAILTHAHLDHCGRLPILVPRGFKGNIWMTPATRDLTELSLLDSAKIARLDAKRYLYDQDLVLKTVKQFKTLGYSQPTQVGDFKITFRNAGHILGSASVEIEDTKPDSACRKIVFSGDLGNSPEDLLPETDLIDDADVVVIESTYGDKLHPVGNAWDALQAEINAVETAGGTLLIPAFSLDRTQELLHCIMHLKRTGKVAIETPVFLDSPMGERATDIYARYPQEFNAHVQEDLTQGSPFEFQGFSTKMDNLASPKVVIAGSGMMTGGRVVNLAAQYLPQASTRLFIVGYQGEETLGRKLVDGAKQVTIGAKNVQVKATVNHTDTMSSHADQGQLLAWLGHIQEVKKVFVTHGEDEPRAVLARKISADLGIKDVALPILNQEIGC